MSDDALDLMELFNNIIASSEERMYNKNISNKSFDRLSYGAWAIKETLVQMYEYEYYVSIGIIYEILKGQQSDYERYYRANKVRNVRYKYALKSVNHLINIIGGYKHD